MPTEGLRLPAAEVVQRNIEATEQAVGSVVIGPAVAHQVRHAARRYSAASTITVVAGVTVRRRVRIRPI